MSWFSWSLLSALFAAATALLAKAGVEGISSNLATAIRTLVVVIFAWLIVAATYSAGELSQVTTRGWLYLLLSGLATGLSWLCYFKALQMGPASKVAPIDKLSVVFVILFAAAFLGERLSLLKVAAGLMIAAGAITLVFA
jgi:bacterial/archaeal transporter family protein